MGIGGSDVQFLDIAFLIGTGMLFVPEIGDAQFVETAKQVEIGDA